MNEERDVTPRTIIWCDRVKHLVIESRSEVADLIDRVVGDLDGSEPAQGMHPRGFAYFGVAEVGGIGGGQRALSVRKISSYEAFPGEAV